MIYGFDHHCYPPTYNFAFVAITAVVIVRRFFLLNLLISYLSLKRAFYITVIDRYLESRNFDELYALKNLNLENLTAMITFNYYNFNLSFKFKELC